VKFCLAGRKATGKVLFNDLFFIGISIYGDIGGTYYGKPEDV
jgi:hypothetical protein